MIDPQSHLVDLMNKCELNILLNTFSNTFTRHIQRYIGIYIFKDLRSNEGKIIWFKNKN